MRKTFYTWAIGAIALLQLTTIHSTGETATGNPSSSAVTEGAATEGATNEAKFLSLSFSKASPVDATAKEKKAETLAKKDEKTDAQATDAKTTEAKEKEAKEKETTPPKKKEGEILSSADGSKIISQIIVDLIAAQATPDKRDIDDELRKLLLKNIASTVNENTSISIATIESKGASATEIVSFNMAKDPNIFKNIQKQQEDNVKVASTMPIEMLLNEEDLKRLIDLKKKRPEISVCFRIRNIGVCPLPNKIEDLKKDIQGKSIGDIITNGDIYSENIELSKLLDSLVEEEDKGFFSTWWAWLLGGSIIVIAVAIGVGYWVNSTKRAA
ncbi:hypothetical protein NEFER03_1199 [Nematocida sp. LUAm3]|nr:hypothetical protein NEFER03_1199 [Nematocida sp. LUAm3]KAI5175808.1 hypothetical protein NEFER02_1677 [Nematocida sp. LUAm2]KAI5178304.1 hypothetical protein NEFER01_1471 [Nematocida sp. LUAm1]